MNTYLLLVNAKTSLLLYLQRNNHLLSLYRADHDAFHKMLLYEQIQTHQRRTGYNNDGVLENLVESLQLLCQLGVCNL